MSIALSAILLVVGQASSTLPVKDNPKVIQDVTECRELEDPAERLACFDAATKTLEEATESREVIVVETAEIEKEKERRFGFKLPDLGAIFDGPDENAVVDLNSTIEKVTSFGYARYRFALADGSVWETVEAVPSLRTRKGDTIRIKKAALGSFLASIDREAAVRVSRVK